MMQVYQYESISPILPCAHIDVSMSVSMKSTQPSIQESIHTCVRVYVCMLTGVRAYM